jgi:phthiocerol/phenolphthiocerol synthesis type-I polyketide synthase D
VKPLLSLDASAMQTVFAPKVTGSFILHQVLAKAELDFFVSFSSGASLVGSAGQGNYAAASAFLDALAQHRRLQGSPALSLNLGAVSQIGFGGTLEGRRVHEYWERHGIRRISPPDVLAALEEFVPQARAQIGVMHTDWPLLARSYPRLASLPWASRLIKKKSKTSESARSPAGGSGEIMAKIAAAAEDKRHEIIAGHLCTNVALVLGMPASEIDSGQPLTNLGFDSLMALDLKSRVEADFGVVLPPARLLENPTIDSLTGGILELLDGREAKPAAVGAKAGPAWDEGEL